MSFIHLALRGVATRHLTSSSLTGFSKSRISQRVAFSTASTLDKTHIETRVLDVLKSFEKVHPGKVRSDSDVQFVAIYSVLVAQTVRLLHE